MHLLLGEKYHCDNYKVVEEQNTATVNGLRYENLGGTNFSYLNKGLACFHTLQDIMIFTGHLFTLLATNTEQMYPTPALT